MLSLAQAETFQEFRARVKAAYESRSVREVMKLYQLPAEREAAYRSFVGRELQEKWQAVNIQLTKVPDAARVPEVSSGKMFYYTKPPSDAVSIQFDEGRMTIVPCGQSGDRWFLFANSAVKSIENPGERTSAIILVTAQPENAVIPDIVVAHRIGSLLTFHQVGVDCVLQVGVVDSLIVPASPNAEKLTVRIIEAHKPENEAKVLLEKSFPGATGGSWKAE